MGEETKSIQQNEESPYVILVKRINMHEAKYKYMHIGLIQVAIKVKN